MLRMLVDSITLQEWITRCIEKAEWNIAVDKPLKTFEGKVIAIIRRNEQDDDKLIVVPNGMNFTDDEIEKAVSFQEKYFSHKLVR